MAEDSIPRRGFLVGAGLATTAAASTLAGIAPAAAPAEPQPDAALTLNAPEMAFVIAAVDTLIPADELTPKGSECGVAAFIDRQLASAWGGGAKMYRSGPFLKGKPEHGYQLPLSPRDYFAAGIAAVNQWTRKTKGKDFDRLTENEGVEVLKTLDAGKADLGEFNGAAFFDAFLTLTMEGFFSDPIYGGNRDKVAWKMVGFPGLPALYADKIEPYRGKRYEPAPQSIADFS